MERGPRKQGPELTANNWPVKCRALPAVFDLRDGLPDRVGTPETVVAEGCPSIALPPSLELRRAGGAAKNAAVWRPLYCGSVSARFPPERIGRFAFPGAAHQPIGRLALPGALFLLN